MVRRTGELGNPESEPTGKGNASAPEATPVTGARARAGWLATTLALAAALVISSLLNYRAAKGAVQTLNMGQVEIHNAALRTATFAAGRDVESAAIIRSVLESQEEAGLRYIGLVEYDGSISVSAGEAIGPVSVPPGIRPGTPIVSPQLFDHDGRVRALVPRPPDRSGVRLVRGRIVGIGPQFYLLEFEPVPASNVVSQAVRGLFMSGLGAAILTLVAVGFWRVSRDYEAAQRQIERQRRLSQLGEMSAVLAHEIRNPLASLKGNAQLLAESLTSDPRMKRRADRVVGEAIRLETLTTDLLDFARTAPVSITPVDPAELLRTTVDEVAPGRVEVDTTNAPASWPLDNDKLRQAIANLLRNACQIAGDGRPPVASVVTEDGNLVFAVRDFGPGIEPSDLGRIFEPFFTTRTQGTGLGLPVAKRIAELHGGSVRADSHPEGGAVFRIVLPGTAA